ncbi:MAG: hypothetical protein O2785_04395, partial [Bacteroidetes bacterium]|nr:hypothetical protein [Bacteroidota bacterium]
NKDTGRVSEPRIQFLNIELLDGIIDSNSKKITLKLESSAIKKEDVIKLKSTLSKYKGSSPIYFDINDYKNEFKLNMISEDTKVNISKELLISLEEDEFIYKLN